MVLSVKTPNLGTSEINFVKKKLDLEKVVNMKKNPRDQLFNLVKVFRDRIRISERPLFCVRTLAIGNNC